MRFVIPAEFIRLPARMKNGTASSGKLSMPPAMRCRMTKSGMPAMKCVYRSEEPASAMNTGTPASSTTRKTKKRSAIVVLSSRRSRKVVHAREPSNEWAITNLLMLRCEERKPRASKHAPAEGRSIGRVASFEARLRLAHQDEGLRRMARMNDLHDPAP